MSSSAASQSPTPQHGGTPAVTAAGSTAGQIPSPQHSGTPVATAAGGTAGQTLLGDIPPGRAIPEGGGGPNSYTFREEWHRARAAAQATWRSGAYLVSASGNFVNNDGVPSSWTLAFIDHPSPDAVLVVEIDPWGKVTSTREITGVGTSSFVGQYTQRVPYAIIDSDTAVGRGRTALASQYDLAQTNFPSLGLNFSLVDGSGPFWTYTLLNEPTAAYVSVRINALTGDVG
jgi:hypothetical protein